MFALVGRGARYTYLTINKTTYNKTIKMLFQSKTDKKEWNPELTSEQLHVLKDKGTEAPGTGKYLYNDRTGVYTCANCDAPLYRSETKFDSGCGWPAFNGEIKGALKYKKDFSHGMMRTEIMCAKCGGHLGHEFKGEGWNKRLNLPNDSRHCVNSLSLNFKKEE